MTLRNFREAVSAEATLDAAWKRVRLNHGAAGIDQESIPDFARMDRKRLARMGEELRRGQYEPLPPRTVALPKRSGGVRRIAILTVRDRIVQQAIHSVLSPILEPLFPPCSFAYRPGVGAHHALRAVRRRLEQGLTWVAESDIAAYFDRIVHRILLDQLSAISPDPYLLTLISRFLAVGALEAGRGIPQGAATSPLFSNLYLADFDRQMTGAGHELVRYGDDFLFLCSTRGESQMALAEAEAYLRRERSLSLQAEKTRVLPLSAGFSFLGFHFNASGIQPSPPALDRLRDRLEESQPEEARTILRGWSRYYGRPPAQPLVHPAGTGEDESDRSVSPSPTSSPVTAAGNPLDAKQDGASTQTDSGTTNRFLELFGGRENAFARESEAKGKRRFTPCAGPLTPELIRSHLSGQETLAAYLLRTDGTTSCIVFDLDAPQGRETETEPVRGMAVTLREVCETYDVPVAMEDSGRKGFHLWVFFSAPIEPQVARRLARLLARRAGFPREHVRLEIFPRHTEWTGPDLGDAVKLPYGLHPVTRRFCPFLDTEGDPIMDVAQALRGIRLLQTNRLPRLLETLLETAPSHRRAEKTHASGPAEELLKRCSVVRSLVERARRTGHLRHTHNLILLYTAGHLGAEGAAFIHETIGLCENYRPEICQQRIDQLDVRHPPITCRRIREWLEEEGETGLCTCSQGRRTPLEGLEPPPKPSQRAIPAGEGKPIETPLEESVWTQVEADLFSMEELPLDPSEALEPPLDGANFDKEDAGDSPVEADGRHDEEGSETTS